MTPTHFENLTSHCFCLLWFEIFWDVTPYRLTNGYRRFEGSTFFETSTVYQSIRRNISEGLNLEQNNDPTDSILGSPVLSHMIASLHLFYHRLSNSFLFPHAVPVTKLLALVWWSPPSVFWYACWSGPRPWWTSSLPASSSVLDQAGTGIQCREQSLKTQTRFVILSWGIPVVCITNNKG